VRHCHGRHHALLWPPVVARCSCASLFHAARDPTFSSAAAVAPATVSTNAYQGRQVSEVGSNLTFLVRSDGCAPDPRLSDQQRSTTTRLGELRPRVPPLSLSRAHHTMFDWIDAALFRLDAVHVYGQRDVISLSLLATTREDSGAPSHISLLPPRPWAMKARLVRRCPTHTAP